MKKILLLAVLILALVLAGCKETKETPQNPNFFRHTVDVQDDGFAPKGLSFGMSLDSFLTEKGLDYGAVEPDAPGTLRVASDDGSFPGIAASVTEVYLFQDEALCSVVYHFWVENEAADPLLQTLRKMAQESLPAPDPSSDMVWSGNDGSRLQIISTELKDGRWLVTFRMDCNT